MSLASRQLSLLNGRGYQAKPARVCTVFLSARAQCIVPTKTTSAEHIGSRKAQLGCSSSVRRQKKPLSRVATSDRIAACQGLKQCWLPSQGASRVSATRLNQSLASLHSKSLSGVLVRAGHLRSCLRNRMPLSPFVPASGALPVIGSSLQSFADESRLPCRAQAPKFGTHV